VGAKQGREASAGGVLAPLSAPLVVLDTSVLIAALTTTDADAESRRVVRAAGTSAIRLALSDELLREAVEVVRRKDRQGQIVSASLAFEAAMDLWSHGSMYHPFRVDWPSIPDREDYWVLDLAWAARVDYIVSLDPHLTMAPLPMPIEVLMPYQLIGRLGL
jgi:putative PIN family toxin of toxin-antitoxin system